MDETKAGKSHDYREVIVFQKPVYKMFSVHTKTKSRHFLNSSGLKSGFEKLRFRDGLMQVVGITVKIKLRF